MISVLGVSVFPGKNLVSEKPEWGKGWVVSHKERLLAGDCFSCFVPELIIRTLGHKK